MSTDHIDFNQNDNFMNLMLKRLVFKMVPELIDSDDIEVRNQDGICYRCKENAAPQLEYKIVGDEHWIKVGKAESLVCGNCRDKELLISAEEIDAQRNEGLMHKYWSIPGDLSEAGFKNYNSINELTDKAKTTCMKYCKHFLSNPLEKRVNLMLMGSPGTGKSHLSAAIARTIRANNFVVGFITTGELLTKIKSTYQKNSPITEEQIINDLKKFDLLILDDLGAETHKVQDFSWTKTTLFAIVNARIKKPTIYSTNLNDKALEEAIGERVASRLNNKTKFIDLFTEDYRKSLRVEELDV